MADASSCYGTVRALFPNLPQVLKAKQREVLVHLVNKTNVLAVLPTGYGKSLLFIVSPLLLSGCCIVVSPLQSINLNIQATCDHYGVSCITLNSDASNAQGNVQSICIRTSQENNIQRPHSWHCVSNQEDDMATSAEFNEHHFRQTRLIEEWESCLEFEQHKDISGHSGNDVNCDQCVEWGKHQERAGVARSW